MLPMLQTEANKRQGRRTDRQQTKGVATSGSFDHKVGKSRDEAAKAVGVGPASVQRAASDNPQDPVPIDLFIEVD
jgi:hypothetical protein